MKRFLIFLLAAGPLFVFGQLLEQSPVLQTFRFSVPMPGPRPLPIPVPLVPMPVPLTLMPGCLPDTALLRPWSISPEDSIVYLPWWTESGDLMRVVPSRSGWGRSIKLPSALPVQLPGELPLPMQRRPYVQYPFMPAFAVREMSPDRMPCLVPLRLPERMPVSLHGNADPLPNAVPRIRH